MNRREAFDIAGKILDLHQELSFQYELRNPKGLKRRYRWFANKVLLKELEYDHSVFGHANKLSVEIYNLVSDWADEYPLEGEK